MCSIIWNDNWRDKLEKEYPAVDTRLAECRNVKADIPLIAGLMRQYNPSTSAEDCLLRTLEWIGDWNSQYEIADLSLDEWRLALKRMGDYV